MNALTPEEFEEMYIEHFRGDIGSSPCPAIDSDIVDGDCSCERSQIVSIFRRMIDAIKEELANRFVEQTRPAIDNFQKEICELKKERDELKLKLDGNYDPDEFPKIKDEMLDYFLLKEKTVDESMLNIPAFEALQDWYLHENQKAKTEASIEEVWGAAWMASYYLHQPKMNAVLQENNILRKALEEIAAGREWGLNPCTSISDEMFAKKVLDSLKKE